MSEDKPWRPWQPSKKLLKEVDQLIKELEEQQLKERRKNVERTF